MKAKAKLIEGSVSSALFYLTVPMIFGIFAVIALNVVDTFFIARFGAEELSAISFTFPIVMILMNVSMGLGVGTTSVVARAIGEGDHKRVQRLTTDSLLLALVIALVCVYGGIQSIQPVFTFLGAPEKLIPKIAEYMNLWYIAFIFVVVPMVGNSCIRSAGNTKFPSLIMALAALINLILDPIMIFGYFGFPTLGLKGAALATLIAYAITFIASLYVLIFKRNMIALPTSFRATFASWKEILHIGMPAIANNVIVPASRGVTTKILSYLGTSFVAGFGIATRIEALSLIVIMALTSTLAPFIGQNWGAGKFDRVKLAIRLSLAFCVTWSLVLTLILFLGKEAIPRLFNSNPFVISSASIYFTLVPISYGAMSVVFLANSSLNAIGHPFSATLLTLFRTLILYVPLALAGLWLAGIKGIFAAFTLANFITAWMAYKLIQERFLNPR